MELTEEFQTLKEVIFLQNSNNCHLFNWDYKNTYGILQKLR